MGAKKIRGWGWTLKGGWGVKGFSEQIVGESGYTRTAQRPARAKVPPWGVVGGGGGWLPDALAGGGEGSSMRGGRGWRRIPGNGLSLRTAQIALAYA